MKVAARQGRPSLRGHVRIARFDHWVKNVFVLPGILVAVAVDPAHTWPLPAWRVLAGLLAVGLVASSNYVLNELLDAPYDRLHPLRRDRPVPAGEVHIAWAWVEWAALAVAGGAVSTLFRSEFVFAMAALWLMGCLYNVRPVRAKDIPFLDVPAEAINNPIRFLAGWYLTGTAAPPITSLLVSYWMAGCYFMAIKRFAEFRDLRYSESLAAYRPCFRWYSERNLLVSVLFYGSLAMLFFGAYMGRYRLEMALSFPFVGAVMAAYFAMAFKPDSAAQRPEALLREPWLMAAVLLCAAVMAALLFADLPWLYEIFTPTPVR